MLCRRSNWRSRSRTRYHECIADAQILHLKEGGDRVERQFSIDGQDDISNLQAEGVQKYRTVRCRYRREESEPLCQGLEALELLRTIRLAPQSLPDRLDEFDRQGCLENDHWKLRIGMLARDLQAIGGCCHVDSPRLQVSRPVVDQATFVADFRASNASSRW